MPKTTRHSETRRPCDDDQLGIPRQEASSQPAPQFKVEQKSDASGKAAPTARSTNGEREWNAMYDRLLEFKRESGHCSVPKNYKDPDEYAHKSKLGIWVYSQRDKFKKGLLPEHRRRRLDEVGFVWGRKLDDVWEETFERLLEFKEEHGHCSVPFEYKDPEKYRGKPKLGLWVSVQRQRLKTGVLSDDRTWRLDEIGFCWKTQPKDDHWNTMFQRLCEYKEKHGHCRVPHRYKADRRLKYAHDIQLGTWVCKQREKKRASQRSAYDA